MHIQKLVFHCISCFANCWLTQLYEGRRSSWRCLSKLRWNWNTNAMHCKKRTLTSSGKCAVLHSQFRLIGDQLSDLKIGAWKLNDIFIFKKSAGIFKNFLSFCAKSKNYEYDRYLDQYAPKNKIILRIRFYAFSEVTASIKIVRKWM